MKVYSRIVINMMTGVAFSVEGHEWQGETAQCKGKGGSSTTITSEPDKEYNARLATAAEQQQDLSNQFFNWWQDVQAPVEEATAKAQLGLIGDQTAIAKEGLTGFKGIQSQFYNASQPTSTEVYAGRAVTDVNRALSASQDTLARNQARMGVSPNSGAAQSAQRDLAIQGAAALAGAANAGRLTGEQQNLQKLSSAMNYGLQG